MILKNQRKEVIAVRNDCNAPEPVALSAEESRRF